MLELVDFILVLVGHFKDSIDHLGGNSVTTITQGKKCIPRSSRLSTRREASTVVRRMDSGWRIRSLIGVVNSRLGGVWIEITVPDFGMSTTIQTRGTKYHSGGEI